MSKLKKLTNNGLLIQSIKILFLRVVGIFTLFGFTFFLTHNYEANIIGQYDFIRMFLLVIGSICVLGTDQSILYFSGVLKSKDKSYNLKYIYFKIIAMIFLMCFLILILLLLLGEKTIITFFNDKNSYKIILKATYIMFFYCLTFFNTEVFRAIESVYVAELYRNTFKYISVFVGAYILLYIGEKSYLVDTFLAGFIILSLISTLQIVLYFNKKDIEKETTKKEYTYKKIFDKSYPMAISSMAVFLLMSFDIIFLKKYKGDATVAYYGIAIKIMTILSMIINTVNVSISTKISKLFFMEEKNDLRNSLRNSSRIIFFLSLPFVLFVCIFPNLVLSFFGKNYILSKQALIILILGQFITSFFGTSQVYLNMTGRQRVFQNILLISVFINFSLNFLLIPNYGMNGAAIAFSISTIFWNFVVALFVYRKDNVKLFLH